MSRRALVASLLNLSATVLLLAGAPLFGWQVYRLWKHTPRLPAAPGATCGEIPGGGAPLSLIAIGESTVAGVGASHQDLALGGATARALAEATGRAVRWQSAGVNGATAASTLTELAPRLSAPAEFALVALGVNDVLGMTTPGRWRRNLSRLIESLRRTNGGPRIVLAGVPPMDRFPQISWPLSVVIGLRARALDINAARVADSTAVAYLPLQIDADPTLFASDGFHPSDHGYARWGRQLAAHIAVRAAVAE